MAVSLNISVTTSDSVRSHWHCVRIAEGGSWWVMALAAEVSREHNPGRLLIQGAETNPSDSPPYGVCTPPSPSDYCTLDLESAACAVQSKNVMLCCLFLKSDHWPCIVQSLARPNRTPPSVGRDMKQMPIDGATSASEPAMLACRLLLFGPLDLRIQNGP